MSEAVTLLPPNTTKAELALEQAVQRGKPALAPVGTLMAPDACPPGVLMWLAWAFSVEVWDEAWSDEDKRATIAGSVDVHRHKGTLLSVRNALRNAGYGEVQIIERFGSETYDGRHARDGSIARGAPDHWAEYRVVLDRPMTIEQSAQVRALLADVAPARAHLKALDFTQVAHLYDGRLQRDGTFSRGVV